MARPDKWGHYTDYSTKLKPLAEEFGARPAPNNDILPLDLQKALTEGYEDIVLFSKILLGMPLHEGQIEFLTKGKEKINILVPANRWGKSITVAVKHIHACFYKRGLGRGNTEGWAKAGYQTANLAPHTEMTQPVFQAIKAIMTSSFPIPQPDGTTINNNCLISWFLDDEHIRNSTPYLIPFMNRSEILFRSGGEDKFDSIQGKRFGYISYDECGRSNWLNHELTANIIPRLADLNGTLDLVSTPDMKSSSILAHYRLFQKGMNRAPGYYAQEGSIAQNKYLLRTNPNYINEMLELYTGDPILDQVIYGKFVFAGDNLFPTTDIAEAIDEDLTVGIAYQKGHSYIIGIDTAIGADEMVYTVIDTTEKPFKVVRIVAAKGSSKSPDIHMADFLALFDHYKQGISNVRVALETWNGESVRFYKDLPLSIAILTKTWGSWTPEGIQRKPTGSRLSKKADILIALRKCLAKHELKLPNDSKLIEQLSIYREQDRELQTDRVMSLALACWLATDGKPKVSTIQYEEVTW